MITGFGGKCVQHRAVDYSIDGYSYQLYGLIEECGGWRFERGSLTGLKSADVNQTSSAKHFGAKDVTRMEQQFFLGYWDAYQLIR